MDSNATLVMMIVFFGVALAIGLGGYALAGAGGSNRVLTKRLEDMKDRFAPTRDAIAKAQMKRIMAVQDNRLDSFFKDFIPRPSELRIRLQRTGKSWTLGQYAAVSVGLAAVTAVVFAFVVGLPFLLGLLLGILIGLGLPHMVIGILINGRKKRFTKLFPDAIDLMVRGLRSGLPIAESLSIVGRELPDPVGIEFRSVADKIRIGRTMEQALNDVGAKIDTPEFKFFMITLSIQRETGGNLAETLSNLSEILRKRFALKLKIAALSSESKASAYIVGSLPFIVFGILYAINPDYMSGFFVDPRLIATAAGGLTWMGIGVFIMWRMINFEI
jgi:tight adherence protein B